MNNTQKYNRSTDHQETRIALLEQSIGHIDQAILRMETKIDNLGISVNLKIDKLDSRIDKIDSRLWQIMFLIAGSVVSIVISRIFHLI